MEIVTSWITLFRLAGEVGEARKSGDTDKLAEAEVALRSYERLCLEADRMIHFPDIPPV